MKTHVRHCFVTNVARPFRFCQWERSASFKVFVLFLNPLVPRVFGSLPKGSVEPPVVVLLQLKTDFVFLQRVVHRLAGAYFTLYM